MRDVSIIGVGRTEFGRQGDYMSHGSGAVTKSVEDVKGQGIFKKEDIEVAYFGCTTHICNAGQMAIMGAGLPGVGVYNVENGFVSGITAFSGAWHDVASGLHDLVLVFGAGSFLKGGALFTDEVGQAWITKKTKNPPYPRLFAQLARRHMKEYGTTEEQLAKIAAKNHKNGILNPIAMLKEEFTADDVLKSEMISNPLTKYMCAPLANGGAALILCPTSHAKYYHDKPIKIAGCALTSGKAGVSYLESAYDATERAARAAYKMVDPFFRPRQTVNVAQVHDAFSITELIACEALGLCDKGNSGEWIDSGASMLSGSLPVNTDGGMMANGYVLGASDLAQVIECVYQLRGEAGDRQVAGAECGLTHIVGSGGSAFCGGFGGRGFGPGGGCGVTILSKE